MEGSVFATYSLEDLVKYGIALLFFFSTVIALCYAVWWGFLMVISAGNEEKVKAAVNHIRYAALGLVILVLILFAAPIFLNLFWLGKYASYFSPSLILSTIQEVATHVLGTSSDTVSNSTNTITVDSNAFSNLD